MPAESDPKPALDALGDLIDTARAQIAECEARHLIATAKRFVRIADQLDEVRTELVSDPSTIAVAWAFIDTGRLAIAQHRVTTAR